METGLKIDSNLQATSVGPTKDQQEQFDVRESIDMDTGKGWSAFLKGLYGRTESYFQKIRRRQYFATCFVYGDQWRTHRFPGLAEATFNSIGPFCHIISSNMTDSQMTWQVSPKFWDRDEMAECWNAILEDFTIDENVIGKNYELVFQSHVKGYGIVKIGHDKSKVIPATYDVISPFRYMAEPGARRPDTDANYHIHWEWLTAASVRDRWPKKWKDKFSYEPPLRRSWEDEYQVATEIGGNKDYMRVVKVCEFYIRYGSDERENIPEKVTKEEMVDERGQLQEGLKPFVIIDQHHDKHIEGHKGFIEETKGQLRQMVASQIAQASALPQGGQQAPGMQQGPQQGPRQAPQGPPQGPQQAQGPQQGPQGGQQAPQMPSDEELDRVAEQMPAIKMARAHITEHEEMKEENPNNTRPRFNGWRRTITAGPDFEILEDGPTPYLDEDSRGVHPFFILPTLQTAGDIYGLSTVELAMPTQESKNRLASRIEDHTAYSSNPIMVLDVTRCPYDPDQIMSMPGIIIPVDYDVDKAMKWLNPPPLGPEVFGHMNQVDGQLALITGVSDAERGEYPRMERASSPFVQQLVQHSRARWRAYQREYENFMRRVGRAVIQRIQQFMTAETQIRIPGQDVRMRTLNRYQQGLGILNDLSRGRWDVGVELVPLSSLTDEAKLARGIQLFSTHNPLGIAALDGQGLAEYVKMPEIHRAWERQLEERMKMAQQGIQAGTGGGQQQTDTTKPAAQGGQTA